MVRTTWHVAAIDASSDRVVASRTPVGWLLPTLVAPDHASQADIFAAVGARLQWPSAPRCLARLQVDTSAESADVLVVVDVDAPAADPAFVRIAGLLDSPAIVSYQRDALRFLDSHQHRPTRAGFFLRPRWLTEVVDWMALVSGWPQGALARSAVVHRADEDGAVVRAQGGEWLHFKGWSRDPLVEARATLAIAGRDASLVPQVLALDLERGWLLTRHVEGVPLDGSLWPAHLAASDAWLRVQQLLHPLEHDLVAFGTPRLTRDAMRAAASDAADAIVERPSPQPCRTTLRRVESLIASLLTDTGLDRALHFDAAPRNILWTGASAVFLDLDALWLGPGIVAGELLARKMTRALSPERRHALREYAMQAFCNAEGRRDLHAHAGDIGALTDLCLLTVKRSQLTDAHAATWQRLAHDFFARLG